MGLKGNEKTWPITHYKERTAVEGGSDSKKGLAQRGREEKRRVPGKLATWLVRNPQHEQPDGPTLTDISMTSLSSQGIQPRTEAMRWGT